MTVIETIASWCAAPPLFGEVAMERARAAFVDTVGCILAGRHDGATRSVLAAFPARSGPSTACDGSRRDAALAALINGTAAHALDFDDNFHGATTHASAVLVPALLAVAQERGRSGPELLDAYIVGLEAQAWVSDGLNPSHYTAGWHATSTVGCIGTAAGVARLIGLDAAGVAAAMSIATSMAAGPKRQFGTPVKPLHAGLAARNAIEAAYLAEAGIVGRPDVLEGPQGYRALTGGAFSRGWDGPAPEALAIERFGLATKRHPCCGASHRTIDTVLDLRREHGFAAADVAGIQATVTRAHARNLSYAEPADEMQARFSMPYCAAVALLHPHLSLSDFTPEGVARPAVRALLGLTTLATYDAASEKAATGRLPHLISLRLKDGRVFEVTRQVAHGEASDPLDEAARHDKFADCADFAGLDAAAAARSYVAARAVDQASAADLAAFALT